MSHRFLAALFTVIVVVSLMPAPAVGQAPTGAAQTWTPPRTSWGEPDLQGIWTNKTITPLERPSEHAGKEFLTEEEAAELEKQTAQTRAAREIDPGPGSVGAYNLVWVDAGTEVLSTRQTSLVVDPPDGRVPVRPEAEEKRDYNRAHSTDSYEYMSVWDRCISRGVPGSMFPAGYNNAYRFLQTPGYLVILHEMIHEVRVIPLDGRSHVGPNIRLWMGDSRGRWEGDTLVVETTNYHDRGWILSSGAGGRIKGVPVSEALHVVERFTRVAADTISWEVTIDDPNVYTRSWTARMPLTSDPNYQIYEYACHEGNHAVQNILTNGRAEEKAAEATAR